MIDGHYESFIVRVWVRSGAIARGEVSHTLSGETARFADLRALTRFLAESIAAPAGESTPLGPVPGGRLKGGVPGEVQGGGIDGVVGVRRDSAAHESEVPSEE